MNFDADELRRYDGVLHQKRQELDQQEAERVAREQERKKAEMRLELDRYTFSLFVSFFTSFILYFLYCFIPFILLFFYS